MCNLRSNRGGDRGVAIVEYVLFLGLFALLALAAAGQLNSGARTFFRSAGSQIGQPINQLAAGSRTASASTTTITAPPSSATVPYPTTSPPTTASPTTSTSTVPALKVVYGTVGDGGTLTLRAPDGNRFTGVVFASYGTPTATYPYSKGSCDAPISLYVVSGQTAGRSEVSIVATTATFGNPCQTSYRRLSVVLSYDANAD